MAMRRGHHTSRVLKALGTANGSPANPATTGVEIISNEFEDLHEEEE
jgi:acetolactate synthase-1/3 small subunit